ncbi:MAG: hypothetical protein AAF989_15640, partial [Planctomycetota bacterium]
MLALIVTAASGFWGAASSAQEAETAGADIEAAAENADESGESTASIETPLKMDSGPPTVGEDSPPEEGEQLMSDEEF